MAAPWKPRRTAETAYVIGSRAVRTASQRLPPVGGNIAPDSIQSGISATLMIAW